jgi:F-type H+-transporting ATPase subunit epsilon
MATSGKQMRCVMVTPEKAVLDQAADLVSLPMSDGELGVMPGRQALIGNMGTGVLRIKSGNQTRRVFVDGGFVQVRDDTITVLTPRAQDGTDIDVEAAKKSISAPVPKDAGPKVMKEHQNTILRARAMIRAAKPF